jgi:hypothetical protein
VKARITITDNDDVDNATATVAIALRAQYPAWSDQEVYNAAMNLRNDIMRGTREIDARAAARTATIRQET